MSKNTAFAIYIGAIAACALCLIVGVVIGVTWMKHDAVENGHAAWHDYQGMKYKRDDFDSYNEYWEASGDAGFTWNFSCERFGPPPPIRKIGGNNYHKGRDWLTPDEVEERKKITANLQYQIERAEQRLENEKAHLESSRQYHKESIEEAEKKVKAYEQELAKLLKQRK